MKFLNLIAGACLFAVSCSGNSHATAYDSSADSIARQLNAALQSAKGHIAVALITPAGDTLTAGTPARQPLMSVFKLHQAIAVARTLDESNIGFDTVLHISASELNPQTWSPIVERNGVRNMEMSVDSLLHYLLVFSDNNASNILFNRIVSPAATDSIVRAITGCDDFRILHTEHDMQLNHDLAYENAATAVDCATLIRRLWTKPIVSTDKQRRLRELLSLCNSAESRMALAVKEIPDACLAHRTGSGYTNTRGEITAVNDVGLILCPDGRQLALAILISDYPGAQHQADSTIASITRLILRTYYPQ